MSLPLGGLTTPAPPTPTGLTVVNTHGTHLQLKWDQSGDEERYHKSFEVYRSDDDFATETLVKSPTKLTEMTDRNMEIGTWYYRVVDVDIYGLKSDPCASVAFEIKKLIPFEDTFAITTAGIPVVKDIEGTIGHKAVEGTIICLGAGKIQVEFSYDGVAYDTLMWLRQEDYHNISSKKDQLKVSKIRFDTDVSGTQVTLAVV